MQRRRDFLEIFYAPICFFGLFVSAVFAQDFVVKNKFQKGDFPLVDKKRTAEIFISKNDFKVVEIAANDLAKDVELVSGVKPNVNFSNENLSKNVIIIGTLGKNPLIEKLIADKKLDVSKLANKRETFQIETIINPFPNVENALVIVGSDRRGTAFGVYEMSQKIGVSPWVWWADVAPEKRENLIISKTKFVSNEPSVKYRGIFLNDEDWGLHPWAAKTFEPETGNIGPKTYAKIFELLLRLKANTCWSAMHEVTKPFNEIPENARVADDYAIVMGSSHAEPMLRNNVGEWKDDKAKYNFVTNEKGVVNYWEERLKTNGKYENIYTLGMRGIHDSPIQGVKTQAERIPVLEKIIQTQRNLLAKYVNENVEEIPQIFVPYKEVLADYRAGLRVPDDVTIVFPDDNFGYIRAFPNAEERKRKGGFGVYYHISYLGRPLSYLWLEYHAARADFRGNVEGLRQRNARFLDAQRRRHQTGGNRHRVFYADGLRREKMERRQSKSIFKKLGDTRIRREKLQLKSPRLWTTIIVSDFERKPEHLQWFLPNETPRKSDLTEAETLERLARLFKHQTTRRSDLQSKFRRSKKTRFTNSFCIPFAPRNWRMKDFSPPNLPKFTKAKIVPTQSFGRENQSRRTRKSSAKRNISTSNCRAENGVT